MTKTNQKKSWLGYLLKFGVPFVVSVGLCYLLFTGIDFKEMMEIIRRECISPSDRMLLSRQCSDR